MAKKFCDVCVKKNFIKMYFCEKRDRVLWFYRFLQRYSYKSWKDSNYSKMGSSYKYYKPRVSWVLRMLSILYSKLRTYNHSSFWFTSNERRLWMETGFGTSYCFRKIKSCMKKATIKSWFFETISFTHWCFKFSNWLCFISALPIWSENYNLLFK